MVNKRTESIELLNATHQFPCAFEFKVIGDANEAFVESVLETISSVTNEQGAPHSTRTTPGGRHISVTVQSVVVEAESVLEIYDLLKKLEGVVMLL